LIRTPPTPDFREILRTHGATVIPPIARTDTGPETLARLQEKENRSFTESLALSVLFMSGENGQATIRSIKKDGMERVAALDDTNIEFYQFLPPLRLASSRERSAIRIHADRR